MASNGRVIVLGLTELRSQLRAVSPRLAKEITKAGRKAARIVVVEARPRVPMGPAAGGHAASSIKPQASQKSVGVVEGGPRFPYMPWLDFGGPYRSTNGRPPHREYKRKGRFVWAAFAARRQEVLDQYQQSLNDAARAAGLEVD